MRELQRSGGPTTAVAARNHVGFSSAEGWLVERPAGGGTERAIVPGLAGRTVEPGDELSWVWFPERTLPAGHDEPDEADLAHFWDATAFAVALVFDDGTRTDDLGAADAPDQYGVPATPAAQDDARMTWVDQWNRRAVDLTPFAGRTIVAAEAIIGRATHGGSAAAPALRGWLDQVEIVRRGADAHRTSRLDRVVTTRGTHASARFSRGNNAPLVGVPHGGVFGLPMTDASSQTWPYAYQEHNRAEDNRPAIQAFATSHIPSPWMGDRGVFQVMPSPLAEPSTDRAERALGFDRADEEAGPHRYRVALDGGVSVEMTAGEFALGFRMRFPDATGSVIVDHHGTVGDVSVTTDGDTTVVEALLDDRVDTPPQYISLRVPGVIADRTTLDAEAGRLGGWLTVRADGPVDVLLGISTVSFADARANLDAASGAEAPVPGAATPVPGAATPGAPARGALATAAPATAAPAPAFDTMLARAAAQWEAKLATLDVEGATDDQLVSIYSDLYRLFLYPNRAGETALTGTPHYRSPYGDVLRSPIRDVPGPEIVDGALTTTNGFWDTYRTAWPLLGLLTPATAGELAQGFVQHFVDGGWTPRWSAPGAEDCMTGTTSDTVFADLVAKGVPGIDLETAYRSAVVNATVPARDDRVGRKGLDAGRFRGFVDVTTPEGMSWTLDAAINDWAASVMASALASRAATDADERARERYETEAEWFARRSLGYRQVFDRERGFFIGRTADGAWRVGESGAHGDAAPAGGTPADAPDGAAAFDPADWGEDYTETNAWGTMFTAPHDGAGIVELHGGPDGFDAAFDRFLGTPETGSSAHAGSYGSPIHEMTEARDVRIGMLGLSNQPAHHIPFFPMFTGRHDLAHRLVRECVERLFVGSDLGQGYPGDEDNGEMSAWYVFATIGLYPLAPATGTYVLVPPSVRRTVLRPAGVRADAAVDVRADGAAGSRPLDGAGGSRPSGGPDRSGGPVTVIEVAPGSAGAYVASVTVDGEPWEDISIPHAVVARGAHIVFTLSDTPTGWAAGSRPVSASALHGFRDGADDVLPIGVSPLTDDLGATVVELAAGESVAVPVSVAAASLYTVTTSEAGTASWEVALVDASGEVVAADLRTDEVFERDGQTRPFRFGGPTALSAGVQDGQLRFTASSPIRLRQLELVAVSARS